MTNVEQDIKDINKRYLKALKDVEAHFLEIIPEHLQHTCKPLKIVKQALYLDD